MPKNTKQDQLGKQIEKHERACKGADKYQWYKKLDYWTLDEGLKLLLKFRTPEKVESQLMQGLLPQERPENLHQY